ncbi:lysozyme inhibitor LprI family protein [Sphingomonas sp.]|jgi:uncharacterized protein YecT (DUF1311 family)|uniref:lysozyme inhibitor LprI family protein n=1 Tax=Sphingomonas sp. TaxID=28214 RepID=UPI002E0FD5C3|nr:lysozyme inhibitor LprI family protein [Sphingomonas sp.]
MLQVTAPQATLIVAAITLVAGLVGWFGRGFTFLIHRWWTGAPKQEQAAYLNSVADLAAKLKASGTTLDEVRQFEKIMRKPSLATSAAATVVVEAIEDEPDTYAAFLSNVAMKARTGADFGVADANLEEAMVNLRLLLSDEETEAFGVAQERWTEYRKALEVCAGLEFEGGTHAPLAGMMAGLTETERRTAEIRLQIRERAAR